MAGIRIVKRHADLLRRGYASFESILSCLLFCSFLKRTDWQDQEKKDHPDYENYNDVFTSPASSGDTFVFKVAARRPSAPRVRYPQLSSLLSYSQA